MFDGINFYLVMIAKIDVGVSCIYVFTEEGYFSNRNTRSPFRSSEAVVAEVVATEATEVEATAEVAAPAPAAVAKKSTKPKAKAKSAAAPKALPVVEDNSKGVSVNTASELQLVAVKGLGVAVVRGIIAGRPYAKLDELCRVKGMGPKLLDKVRDQIKL